MTDPTTSFISGIVIAVSDQVNYILVDGPNDHQYAINKHAAGELWGKFMRGDKVVLEITDEPLSRVLSVRRG